MREAIDHPVFGLLVPDQWGDHVTLRKFPFLPEFAQSEDGASAKDAALVGDWERHIATLAPRARDVSIWSGLHRQGVFEVYVHFGKGELPSTAQTKAFEAFVADEEKVCRNLVDAMLRYYQAARRVAPDYFDPSWSDVDFPDEPDAAALASVLAFDTLKIPRTAVAGVSPLIFSWRPAWDEEHGLSSLVYAGQVVIVGTDEVSDMESSPSDNWFSPLWNRSLMTPAEIAAFETYRRGHEDGATEGA